MHRWKIMSKGWHSCNFVSKKKKIARFVKLKAPKNHTRLGSLNLSRLCCGLWVRGSISFFISYFLCPRFSPSVEEANRIIQSTSFLILYCSANYINFGAKISNLFPVFFFYLRCFLRWAKNQGYSAFFFPYHFHLLGFTFSLFLRVRYFDRPLFSCNFLNYTSLSLSQFEVSVGLFFLCVCVCNL